ncbi:MAG: BamA/TamA family outer membrane protein [Deltaproteobacteria bacterium]|nr:BamA/TamA family outer membrane protein [Deltaproteobacteria bacterium]
MRTPTAPALLLVVAPLAAELAGCVHRAPPATDIVRSVRFEGNGGVFTGTGDFHLEQAMDQQASPWTARLAPGLAVPLDRQALDRDAWRIEVWYAHHGFFDARVEGWDLQRLRPRRGNRPATWRVVGRVTEGEPYLLIDLAIEGFRLGGSTAAESHIRRNAALQVGSRFLLADLDATEAMARLWLQEHGHAQAEVTSSVDVDPEQKTVTVTLTAVPGEAFRFGDVTFEGNDRVPVDLLGDHLSISRCAPFQASQVSATRRALFGLETFSAVDLVPEDPVRDTCPDARTGASQEVLLLPYRIRLAETRPRRLKAGVGVGVESGQQDAHVTLDAHHANLAGRLLTLDAGVTAGVAARATFDDLSAGLGALGTVAPMVDARVQLGWPAFLGSRWRMDQRVQYEQGLESGFRFASPSWTPAFVRVVDFAEASGNRYLGRLTLTTAYRLKYFDYLDLDVDLSRVRSQRLGLDLSDPYLLSFAEERILWTSGFQAGTSTSGEYVPPDGAYVAGSLGMAGGPWGGAPLFGQFDFLKSTLDVRWFWPLRHLVGHQRLPTLALRAAAGAAQPLGSGDRAAIPYAERFLIGGGTTVRGWVADRLGPALCATPTEGGTVFAPVTSDSVCNEIVPIGGASYLLGSVELRQPLRWGLGVVAFLDAGMAWDTAAAFLSSPLLPATGVGFRYASPVGTVRFDLAFRLDDDPRFSQERLWNLHFSLAEAF